MKRNLIWKTFFSQSGSEIYEISNRIGRFPDAILTNKSFEEMDSINPDLLEKAFNRFIFLPKKPTVEVPPGGFVSEKNIGSKFKEEKMGNIKDPYAETKARYKAKLEAQRAKTKGSEVPFNQKLPNVEEGPNMKQYGELPFKDIKKKYLE